MKLIEFSKEFFFDKFSKIINTYKIK